MKLELKHLAPYLPYEVKVYYENKPENLYGLKADMVEISIRRYPYISKELIQNIKPILRPLSDLTKEIEVNGEKFVPMEKIIPLIEYHQEELNKPLSCDPFEAMLINLHSSNNIYNKLLELHFDVFGLIKEGLAIDINTL